MISLVMATYNGEGFIVNQLDSIRNQTVSPDEVLIYDDCSKDNTVSIIKEYIKKYKLNNWSIFENEYNKGYSLNFSDAIKSSKGDIIFLADQDDIWNIDKIEKMRNIMLNNTKIELLASNVLPFYTGESPQKVNYESFDKKLELIHVNNIKKWIKPARPGCSMCVRRSLLIDYDKIWFPKYAHDSLLWGLAVLRNTAYIYNKSTIKFRRHDSNASSRSGHSKEYRIESLNNEINIMKQMYLYQKEINRIDNASFIYEQIEVYKKRKSLIEKNSIIDALMMLSSLKYYARNRFFLTDIFYVFSKYVRSN